MTKEKFNGITDYLREFINSDKYIIMLIAMAAIAIFTRHGVYGTYIIGFVVAFTMVITDDLMPAIEGIMAIACFAIRLKNSGPNFVGSWPLAVPVFIMFIAHFFIYPPKFEKSSVLKAMIFTSVSIVTGGIGAIYWKSYFSPTSLFYMFMLGFGMILICSYFSASFREDRGYDIRERFSRMMVMTIIILVIGIFQEYATHFDEFIAVKSTLPFQWRNNASTLLMLAMPFAFYFAAAKFGFAFIGLLDFLAIVFTGSRGGLIFGAVELAMCVIVMTVIDKKHRKYYIAAMIACAVIGLIGIKLIFAILTSAVARMLNPEENSIRLELFRRGIFIDFRNNPIFGQGLAYMGNRDVHASAKHALCWYHCSLVQVPASFGVVGIAAYIYLNITRIKVFRKNISFYNLIMFLSFIGLEMMSLVNPGIFAPFPYLFLVTLYFIMMEKFGKNGDKTISKLRRGE